MIGTPVAGRGEPGLENLVGMFVNTLALRTEVDGRDSFAGLLNRVREVDLRAFEHGDVPFERIVEQLNPQRSTAHHPIFQGRLVVISDHVSPYATTSPARVAATPVSYTHLTLPTILRV